MKIYLQDLDYEIWEAVTNDLFMPTTKNKEGEEILKSSREQSEVEKKKASLNSNAMNALFCALDKKEYNKVSGHSNAYLILRKLEVIYK